MNNLKLTLLNVAIVLAGCSAKTPNCSDESSTKLVLDIVDETITATSGNIPFSADIKFKSKLSVNTISTVDHDEKLDRYSCKATLVYKLDSGVVQNITTSPEKALLKINEVFFMTPMERNPHNDLAFMAKIQEATNNANIGGTLLQLITSKAVTPEVKSDITYTLSSIEDKDKKGAFSAEVIGDDKQYATIIFLGMIEKMMLMGSNSPVAVPVSAATSVPSATTEPVVVPAPVVASAAVVVPESVVVPTNPTQATQKNESVEASDEKRLPSFDCRKAATIQEKLICSDNALSRLDSELGVLYQEAKYVADDKNAIQREQMEWLKNKRNACSDVACLLDAYNNRIEQFNH